MNILHINGNATGTNFYSNLYAALSALDVHQHVWVPHKKYRTYGTPDTIDNLSYTFSGYQDVLDRVLFRRKIAKGVRFLESKHLARNVSLCHAYTLFSDGALAYELWKKKKIPYLVTIRNTDINIFWRYFPHLRSYAKNILLNAEDVVFISPAYKAQMPILVGETFWHEILTKHHVIPNGIDSYWLQNRPKNLVSPADEVKVLFIGQFNKNKNIHSLLQACAQLRKSGTRVSLRLVGASKTDDNSYAETYPWVEVFGYCASKHEISDHYRWADVFAMASYKETFGLVYAEALSQGKAVLYTKGQGFDGWVTDAACGYGADPSDIRDIATGIKTLWLKGDFQKCVSAAQNFNWEEVAKQYHFIYKKILQSQLP